MKQDGSTPGCGTHPEAASGLPAAVSTTTGKIER